MSMNAKEIIEKLRVQFNDLVNQPTQQVKLMDATLADGTAVQVTELVVGGIVTIDGVPAPVGEHTLSDGTKIVLGDNGVIMEIMPPTEVPVEIEIEAKKKDDEMMSKFSAFQNSANEKFSTYESKFATYESRFADYDNKLNKATQMIDALINLSKTLAETPTGVPDMAIKSDNKFKAEKEFKHDALFSKN